MNIEQNPGKTPLTPEAIVHAFGAQYRLTNISGESPPPDKLEVLRRTMALGYVASLAIGLAHEGYGSDPEEALRQQTAVADMASSFYTDLVMQLMGTENLPPDDVFDATQAEASNLANAFFREATGQEQ